MNYFILFIKGCILGIAAIIPGFSIGTMALVLEVYERAITSLVIIMSPRSWRHFSHFSPAISFLAPLIFGILCAMILFAKIVFFLFENYPIFIKMSFFGIILASIPHLFIAYIKPLYRRSQWGLFMLYAIGGFIIIYALSGNMEQSAQLQKVDATIFEGVRAFVFAIIAAVAGIIPGISGSYVLLLLGYYHSYLYIISTPVILLLVPIIIGTIIGIIWIAFFVNVVFKKFPKIAYALIFGIVFGSLWRIISFRQFVELSSLHKGIALMCLFTGILFTKLCLQLKKSGK